MVKEFFIGRAEVVEPPFALGRPCETMLWAFAVTGKTYTTLTAVVWQCIAFGITKIDCHWTVCQFTKGGIH